MTPEYKTLDSALLINESPLTLYRLTSRKYALSLSGIGAALYAGRWNRPGEEAIYTSTQVGVCVLERLAHTPKDRIPTDLALMTIHLSADWHLSRSGRLASDRSTGAELVICSRLADAKVHYIQRGFASSSMALAVPSVIVPAWNVILYPGGKAFWNHVSLVSVEPFDYDPRLFPEEAVVQL